MEVTREDVLRCAALTRLSLLEEEIEPLRQDMARLLSHAQSLDGLPLDGVEPSTHGLDLPLPRREDDAREASPRPRPWPTRPQADAGHFVVPKVM